MSSLFLKIVNMSIAASWLILAVVLLRVVLREAPKWINVLLWGAVAIRLLCPDYHRKQFEHGAKRRGFSE